MPSREPTVDPLGEIEALIRELASLETQLSGKKINRAQYDAAAKGLMEQITDAESLAYAMAKTNESIAKKLREKNFRDPIIQQVSNHFLQGSKKPLEPEFGADRIPRYYVVGDGGRVPVDSATLNQMVDIGILKSTLFEKMLVCPKCGTQSNVFARFKCTNCASIDVSINRMIEHLACGTIHNEKAFLLGKQMVCPTCKKKLQKPEEQRLIGLVCTCNKCGAHFEDPSQSFFCRTCQSDFNLITGVISDICIYDINEKIIGEIRSQLCLPGIAKMLEDNGFGLAIPGIIAGKGKEIQFSIVASKQSMVAGIDIAISESEVAVEPVLELYVKLLEAKPDVSVFGAMPRLSDQARNVASVHGISVAEGITPDALGRKILEIVGGDVLSQRVSK